MEIFSPPTARQIRQAADQLTARNSAYESILGFYVPVFTAQEASLPQIRIGPPQLSAETLAARRRGGFPLTSLSDFELDVDACQALLRKICKIAAGAGPDLARTAAGLAAAVDREKALSGELFTALLQEKDPVLARAADRMGIDQKLLGVFLYSSIRPSIVKGARQLSRYLDRETAWAAGYCPICGAWPGLSLFGGEGQRFLICNFCGHKWPAGRVFCPFCKNREGRSLHYFFSEQEREYRVDVCDRCERYIKTVDLRHTDRIFYAPLEQVATLHLDIKAAGMGLAAGTAPVAAV